MRLIRTTALFAVLAALSASSLAQEGAAPPAATPPPATTPESPAAPPPAAQPPAAPRRPVNDDTFIPTEELSADEQVTFPVDI